MHRTLDSGIYADPRWRSVPAAGRWLYVYLCTNPHSHISGLYYLPKVFMTHETGLSLEVVETSLSRLCTVELCQYDDAGEVVWVIDLLRWQGWVNQTISGKLEKPIVAHLKSLAHCPLVPQWVRHYADWCFVRSPAADRVSIPYAYGIDTPRGKRQEVRGKRLEEKSARAPDDARDERPRARRITPQELVDGWNEICGGEGLPRKLKLTDGLHRKLQARIRTYPRYAFWEAVINWIANNRRYHGENKTGWKCTLNWLMANDEHPLSVYEEIPHGTAQRLEALGPERQRPRAAAG